ncbi:MAG: hypothetical protein P8017_18840 [Deltaproteobacteria bacterium]|jgi:high-affinity Fe2+/Pb2+ permease
MIVLYPSINNIVIGIIGAVLLINSLIISTVVAYRYGEKHPTMVTLSGMIWCVIIGFTIYFSPLKMNWLWFFGGLIAGFLGLMIIYGLLMLVLPEKWKRAILQKQAEWATTVADVSKRSEL